MKQVHGGRLIMRCPTRARLERRMKYVTATLDYARKNLLAKAATCSEAEWLVLLDYVDRAGDLMTHAQAALDLHLRHHSCLGEDGVAAVLAGAAQQQ